MVAKAIFKGLSAILKNSGEAGEKVQRFLNKSQDEIEDFVVHSRFMQRDKRSINEIIKEDGEEGVKKLAKAIRRRPGYPDAAEKEELIKIGRREMSKPPPPGSEAEKLRKRYEESKKDRKELTEAFSFSKTKRDAAGYDDLLKKFNKKYPPTKKAKGGAVKKKRSAKKAKGVVTKWESKWG